MPGDFFFYGNDGNESIYVHVVWKIWKAFKICK